MTTAQDRFKIQTVFPTPVISTSIDRVYTEQELGAISEQKNNSQKLVGNTVSVNNNVLDLTELSDVKLWIEEQVKWYMDNIITPEQNVELYITQSWLNWTDPGEIHHAHAHSNSIVSGVMYIDVQDDVDYITFLKSSYNAIHIPTARANIFNCDRWTLRVNTGELVLFPSNLIHSVEPTSHDKTRISLAFNTFARGDLGANESKSLLKL